MTDNKILQIGVGVAAAAGLIKLLMSGKGESDAFDTVIAQSSRLIAGSRAMEAEEAEPLVADPFAAALAGKSGLTASRRRQQPAPKGSGRKNKINKMAIRTKWFDDQLLASLDMPLGSLLTLDNYITSTLPADGIAPRQVVVLGSGMDTRPWRLRLPADTEWYEVDQGQVLGAKVQILQNHGAEIEPTSPMHHAMSANTSLEAKIGTLDHHAHNANYPLRSETWVGVPTDLNDPKWLVDLKQSGFDPLRKTIWVLEGLLMYLTPERAAALLKEIAGASAPGSTLLANNVMDKVVEKTSQLPPSNLMSEWKFGWPHDVGAFLGTTGWKVKLSTNRAKIAHALRIPTSWCGFPTDPAMATGDRASLFIVATV